jgi:hypothetical protein
MRSTHAQRVLVATLTLLLAVCWAIVIFTAVHVSTIVLQTLEMIVDLAAISP